MSSSTPAVPPLPSPSPSPRTAELLKAGPDAWRKCADDLPREALVDCCGELLAIIARLQGRRGSWLEEKDRPEEGAAAKPSPATPMAPEPPVGDAPVAPTPPPRKSPASAALPPPSAVLTAIVVPTSTAPAVDPGAPTTPKSMLIPKAIDLTAALQKTAPLPMLQPKRFVPPSASPTPAQAPAPTTGPAPGPAPGRQKKSRRSATTHHAPPEGETATARPARVASAPRVPPAPTVVVQTVAAPAAASLLPEPTAVMVQHAATVGAAMGMKRKTSLSSDRSSGPLRGSPARDALGDSTSKSSRASKAASDVLATSTSGQFWSATDSTQRRPGAAFSSLHDLEVILPFAEQPAALPLAVEPKEEKDTPLVASSPHTPTSAHGGTSSTHSGGVRSEAEEVRSNSSAALRPSPPHIARPSGSARPASDVQQSRPQVAHQATAEQHASDPVVFPPVSSVHIPLGTKLAKIRVPLREILYYQDYISNRFGDGLAFQHTIDQLRSGEQSPETLPLMDCLYWRGRWYGMGNRRLTCFSVAYANDPDKTIPVLATRIADDESMMPQGNGRSIHIGSCGAQIDGRWITEYTKPHR